ncbi:MAG: 4Fe-4S dicluster domain-containing protein [Firmicutes bacterium]|nr:4Fe-4S dicluster domain-containing protein [Bacillota bacterium]
MSKFKNQIILLVRQWFLSEDLSLDGQLTRRGLVKILGLIFFLLAPILMLPKIAFGRKKIKKKKKKFTGEPPGPTPKWGMVIDLDKCTGCGGCVAACMAENNIPISRDGELYFGTQIYWMELLDPQQKVGPELKQAGLIPLPCMQCEDPPCVKVCPVGATMIDEEGIVAQIYDRCIGCRFCMQACPYSRRYFNWAEPYWPETYKNYINPNVSLRPRGVVEKCSFCFQRIRNVREIAELLNQPIKDEQVQRLPACAEVCPARAITFGDLNNPESLVSKLSQSPRAFQLLHAEGTKPKVTYLTKTTGGLSRNE